MVVYDWDNEKNSILMEERRISFEEIIVHIENGNLVDTIKHPNSEKYPNQEVHIVNANNYIYLVPFVQEKNIIFLKTIIPSRKFTKLYLGSK